MYNNVTASDKIIDIFTKLSNLDLKVSQVVNYTKKYLSKHNISTLVTLSKSQSVDPGDILVSAYYDKDNDEDDDIPFELALIVHPGTEMINWNSAKWREFALALIDNLEHELIHQHQYRSRDFMSNRGYKSNHPNPNVKEAQEYLGNPDEIDAYAHNLASEMIRKSNDYDQALRLIKTFATTAMTKDQAGRFLSPSLYGYVKEFEFNNKHPVIKRLMKKTYQNIMFQKKKDERAQRIQTRNDEVEKRKKELREKEALDKAQGRSYTAIVSR